MLSALIGYAHLETKWFKVVRVQVPVLPPGQQPIRILQLADLHLVENQRIKLTWLARLADLKPNLVVDTGDNISSAAAIPALLAALSTPGPRGGRALLDVPGVFVGGSNDYFAPKPRNALRYLMGPSKRRAGAKAAKLPWRQLFGGFVDRGWVSLNNHRASVRLADGRVLSFVGTNDAHIGLAKFPAPGAAVGHGLAAEPQVAGVVVSDAAAPGGSSAQTTAPSSSENQLAIAQPQAPVVHLGVTHAPYQRLLNEFEADGVQLAIAGHTHGGQLRVPGFGALVTNSDLKRKYASGLHRWHQKMWFYVSAGAGTSPYAPFRFWCRPSATLIKLLPVPEN